MGKAPAFQFYPADWVMSTRTIPVEARGVHIDLLAFAWTENGLPSSLDGLHSYIGLSQRKFQALWDTHLAHRWEEDDRGRLVNPRQEEEREKQQRWRDKSAKGGRAGAKARANQ